MFKSLVEYFFGEWVCVVSALAKGSDDLLIVCHQHSVTKRVKGYVDSPRYTQKHPLETHVVHEHIAKYGNKS